MHVEDHVHYGMMMMAAAVRRIGAIQPVERPSVNADTLARAVRCGKRCGFAVDDQWTIERFLGMNGKFWGEPWGFENTS